MDIQFSKMSAHWVKYSGYEYRKGEDDVLYIMPTAAAEPAVYDPMKDPEQLVVDALNVGRVAMAHKDGDDVLKDAVLEFVQTYGLLGFMPALPTTPDFLNYDAVYLATNNFIREETLKAEDYLSHFFPFHKPDIYKDKEKACWSISTDGYSKEVMAVVMTYSDEPWAVPLSLLPTYAERYDWLVTQFRDWAYMLVAAVLYYQDKETATGQTLDLYRKGVAAFGSRVPTYHIGLYDDNPKIVWDFHSLLLTVQTLFAFALTDAKRPMRICKHCGKAFITSNRKAEFCGTKCKSQYNAHNSRK